MKSGVEHKANMKGASGTGRAVDVLQQYPSAIHRFSIPSLQGADSVLPSGLSENQLYSMMMIVWLDNVEEVGGGLGFLMPPPCSSF